MLVLLPSREGADRIEVYHKTIWRKSEVRVDIKQGDREGSVTDAR